MKISAQEAYDNEYGADYWGNRGAGVLAVAKDTGNILVGLRSAYVNEPGTWGTIGGKVDDDEDFEAAALREFEEETGYSGPIELISGYKFVDAQVFEYQNFIGVVPEEFDVGATTWETSSFAWMSYEEVTGLSPKHHGLEALLSFDATKIKDLVQRKSTMDRLSKIIAYLKRMSQSIGDIPIRDEDINPLSIQRSPVSEAKKERNKDKNKSKRKKDEDATILGVDGDPGSIGIFNMAPEYRGTPHAAQFDERALKAEVYNWLVDNYDVFSSNADRVEAAGIDFGHPEWEDDQYHWIWDLVEDADDIEYLSDRGITMKKLSQMDLTDGLSEDKIVQIEESLRSSGLPQEKIDEIADSLRATYENTEEVGTTDPMSPEAPQAPPQPDTGKRVMRKWRPGKLLGSQVVTADELLRRVSMSRRLQLCADDLAIFEEEVEAAAEYLVEEEGLDFDVAWDLAAETIYNEFKGE